MEATGRKKLELPVRRHEDTAGLHVSHSAAGETPALPCASAPAASPGVAEKAQDGVLW